MLNCYFRQMKYISKILLAVILVGLVSCVPSKKMVYLQGADGLEQSPQTIAQDYELKIVPDDQLLITVSSKDGELLEIFSNSQVLGSTGASTTIQETVGLRVDKDGKIEVPILGEMQAGGLSRRELADAVENKLIEGEYVKDPVVNVQIKGFKVSVMGEVNSPGVQTISGDRITLLDLKQNDVIYVQPNKSIGVKGSSTLSFISAGSSIISLVASVLSIVSMIIVLKDK